MLYIRRKKATKVPGELDVKAVPTPYYSTVTSPCYVSSPSKKPGTTPYYSTVMPPCYATSHYSRLQRNNAPTIAPVQKSTSDNCLALYEEIYSKTSEQSEEQAQQCYKLSHTTVK